MFDHKDFLKYLRGKHRRAMLLAISDANTKYAASCKESLARYKEIEPIINAAYDRWKSAVEILNKDFFDSIPKDALDRMGFLSSSLDSPISVRNYAGNYYRDDAKLRHALFGDLYKLSNFLHSKQQEEPFTPKVTKQDTEARKLIEEYDASKALCSTNPAGADAPSPTPNPDGSLDAERI